MSTQSKTEKIPYDISQLREGEPYRLGFAKSFKYLGYSIPVIIFVVTAILLSPDSPRTFQTIFNQFFNLVIVGALIFSVWVFVRSRIYEKSVDRFAIANHLDELGQDQMLSCIPPCINDPDGYDVQLKGFSMKISNLDIRVFDYTYTTGTSRYKEDHHYAVAAVPLTKGYPHIFLDSKANGREYKYDGSQKVELEGDFNKYFELFIPKNSEAGALTILTPDVMQTLVNLAKPYDIEIEGNVVCIVAQGSAFTKENVSGFLTLSGALSKEFGELNKSWSPMLNAKGEVFALKKRTSSTLFLIIGFTIAGLLMFYIYNHYIVSLLNNL